MIPRYVPHAATGEHRERYVATFRINVRQGASSAALTAARATPWGNRSRRFSDGQILARLNKLTPATLAKLREQDFKAIAEAVKLQYAFMERDGWQDVYRVWCASAGRDPVAVDAEISEVEAMVSAVAVDDKVRPFETLTEWADTVEAVATDMLPPIFEKDSLRSVKLLPKVLPKWGKPMAQADIKAARLANLQKWAMLTPHSIMLKNQAVIDRLHQGLEALLTIMRDPKIKPEQHTEYLDQYNEGLARLNELLDAGKGFRPGTDVWRNFQSIVMLFNGDTGTGKTTASVKDAADMVKASAQFAKLCQDTPKIREFYADMKRQLGESSPEILERIVYRPGRESLDPDVYHVEDGTPHKDEWLMKMCLRADEANVFGKFGARPQIMCKGCAFHDVCPYIAMRASEQYQNALGILGAGASWIANPASLAADEDCFEPNGVTIDDPTLSSFFDTFEIRLATLRLPTVEELRGKPSVSSRDHPGEQQLRGFLADYQWIMLNRPGTGLTRFAKDRHGVPLSIKYDKFRILKRLNAYTALPKEGRGEVGYAHTEPVRRVLGAMAQVATVRALVEAVLSVSLYDIFQHPAADEIFGPWHQRNATRWSMDVERRGGSVVHHLTMVKRIKTSNYTNIAVLDGTGDAELLQFLLMRPVVGGDQPRVIHGAKTVKTQFVGSIYGKTRNTPPSEAARAEVEKAKSQRDKIHERLLAACAEGDTPHTHPALVAAEKQYQELRKAIDPSLNSAAKIFAAATRKALELNAKDGLTPEQRGAQLLVITHKAMAEKLSRMRKVRGGEFLVLSISQSRGLNAYSGVAEVWIIGRPGTPARLAIRYAAAILNEVIEAEEVDYTTGAYWMADGSMIPALGQETLSHWLAQKILVQLTAAEIYQGLNRARPTIRQNDEIEIVIFTSVAIPWLQVNHVINREPLREWGNPMRRMTLEVVPDLSEGGGKFDLYGHLMGISAKAAKDRFDGSRDVEGNKADRDAYDALLAMAADGTLARLGWGRFRVTLGKPVITSSKRAAKIAKELQGVVWLNCEPGDVAGAAEILRDLGGVLQGEASVVAVGVPGGSNCYPNCHIAPFCVSIPSKDYILEVETQTAPAVTVGTPEVTVGPDTPSDVLDQLISLGVVPRLGAKGYTELAALVTRRSAGAIRKKAATNPAFKARWQAYVPSEAACTHRVTLLGTGFSIPARLTEAGEALLRSLRCKVDPITPTPPDGPGKGTGSDIADQTTRAPAEATGTGYIAPGVTIQRFTDPAEARAAHMRRDALGLAEVIAAGRNDLELMGFDPAEADELLAMAREIAARHRAEAATAEPPPG